MKKNHRIFAISLGLILCALLSGYGLFRVSKLRTFQFFGNLTARVQTDDNVVAITFDDAPTEYSNDVVDILTEKGIKATFYVIGQNTEMHPDEAKYIVGHGHELGNHSYSHSRFLLQSLSFIDHEIQTTNQLIQDAGYQGEITFRPPGGKKLFLLPWYLKQHNMKTIMWDVEPDTYVAGDAVAITDFTLTNTQPGSIILLHPFCPSHCQADREALPHIIDKLREKGYQFLTVSELLKCNQAAE
jgi:peptidoglycan/xylan/chitin deacetylase (PgdA/CDA1 family)